ncbi:hypothetical protein H6G96_37830 [Nostoc sp. FACHB-892]|uniref:hypothetical protein n=1 Tax=Nostoc sp. FACHB-892 TaxID=2692843 RepID=UPI001688DB92|nr:hypothetical protein [Nostoc sp. FACHB-892]MBD2731880.1 hypothetical protein [Nostoc sp. FACHB-892]
MSEPGVINQQQHAVIGIDHCVDGVAHGFVSFLIQYSINVVFSSLSGACPVLVLSFFRNKFNIGDRFQAVVYSKLKFLQYKLIE